MERHMLLVRDLEKLADEMGSYRNCGPPAGTCQIGDNVHELLTAPALRGSSQRFKKKKKDYRSLLCSKSHANFSSGQP